MELSDRELLERFAIGHDDAAFRALVEKHLPLVHGVARRVTGNEDLARDVAQNSFLKLAQRAALVPKDLPLPAWLHRVTHHLAIDLVRSEDRRKKRELAANDPIAMDTTPSPDWSALAPLVDTLINRLSTADREVLLLRYYRNEPHAVVARELGLSEAVAKKRATRALEKLRGLLSKQGIATSAAVLATLLPAHAATPVPGTYVLAVSTAAKSAVPLAASAINIHLAMTTAQKTAIAMSALIFLGSVGYAVRGDSTETAVAVMPAPAGNGESEAATAGGRASRRSSLSAAERLERLRRIISLPGEMERRRQLLAFIDELAPEQLAETAGQLQQLEIAFNREEFRILLGEWAKIDSQTAAAWAHDRGSTDALYPIVKVWGEADPAPALDWVVRQFPDATGHDRAQRQPLIAVLSGIAAKDIPQAVRGLQVIPDGKDRLSVTQDLAAELAIRHPRAIEEMVDALGEDEGAQRSEFVAWAAKMMVATGGRGERGLELLLADEGARKLQPIGEFFKDWTYYKPPEALAGIEKVPEGSLRDEAVGSYCVAAVNRNAPELFALLRRYPGAATDMVVAGMVQNCPLEQVGLAVEQALQMQNTAMRDEVLTGRLQWWISRDESAARRWLESHEIPPTIREKLENPSPKPESP